MEYIKFKDPKKLKKAKKKEYLANLEKSVLGKYRKGQAINLISQILGCIIFAVVWFLLDKLTDLIKLPEEDTFVILEGLIDIIGCAVNVLIAGLVSIFFYVLMQIFVPSEYVTANVEIAKAVSDELRSFYSFSGNDYVVTKCYESSDNRFKDKDIVLYRAGEEIRIAVNLNHNFYSSGKDLGCYIVSKNEISVVKTVHKGINAAELKFSDQIFLLGKRAISFLNQ